MKRELVVELQGLQCRRQELLTQLSSLAPPTVAMETLHRLRETSNDLHRQMGEWYMALVIVVDTDEQ